MKKKILFLLEAFDKGGIEKVTLDIVNGLDPEKYDITVQTFWYGGHCQSQVGSHVKVLPFFFKRYVPGIIRLIEHLPPKWLYRLFVRGKYDVEIAASDGGAAKVIAGSSNKKARKVCWVHMDVVERGSKLKEYQDPHIARKIYERFDTIACVSSQCLDKFRQKFGDYPDMRTVHNPLPDEDIRKKATEYTVERSAPVEFATVGRLAVEKGFDRLIEASRRLRDEGHDFRVHIVGDGEKKDQLTGLVARYELQDTVLLHGYAADPYPYIAAADWYLCTSLDESFSLSVGEALILGTPVMGTDCSGIREWLGHDEHGIVMENSTDGICRGMKSALEMTAEDYQIWKDRAVQKADQIRFDTQMADWSADMLEA